VRVVAGRLGGRRLRAPRGRDTRPTSDRVREALFSMLGPLDGARVLDLFAGSGALAIEALSRGASEATLVDTHPRSARKNVEDLDLADRATVIRADASRFLRRAEEGSYDLVLCDPPYRLADRLAADLDPLIRGVLAESGRVMTESSPDNPLQIELPVLTERTYGDTLIRVYGGNR
jgi:16S rRNA (guanine966-N2)-methyltransferase